MDKTTLMVNTTVSTTITLPAISLEKYFRILDFIERETGNKTPVYPPTQTVPVEPLEPVENKETKEDDDCNEEDDPYISKLYGAPRYEGRENIIKILKQAYKFPHQYEWKWVNSHQFAKAHPETKEMINHRGYTAIGNILGWCAKYKLSNHKRECRYNEVERKYINLFYAPMPKPYNKRKGEILKKAREKAEINIADFAELIGYKEDTVKKWESGEYTISYGAETEIKNVFGNDIFKEASA